MTIYIFDSLSTSNKLLTSRRDAFRSPQRILPTRLRKHSNTNVYLDERHIQWMSDAILQHVLSDIRPHLLSKLKAETDVLGSNSSRKSTVDTHRGDTYQFCYFLRKTEPHSLVMKSRNFRAVKPQPQNGKGKRKEVPQRGSSPSARRKKPKTGHQPQATESDQEDWNMDEDESHPTAVPSNDTAQIQEVAEEDSAKPVLSLTYRGFRIYGHCLCIVVEPWPVVRKTTSCDANPSNSVNTVTMGNSFVEGNVHELRKEPLFLPEELDDNTPLLGNAGQYVNKTYLNQVIEDIPDDEDVGGMMEFSQVLRSIGDTRPGAMNDDEDTDGAVLFGDADENKDL